MSKNIISRMLLVSSLSLNSIVFLVICMIFTTGLVSLQPIFLGKINDVIAGIVNILLRLDSSIISSIFRKSSWLKLNICYFMRGEDFVTAELFANNSYILV